VNKVEKLFCYNPWTSTQVNSSAEVSFCPAAIKKNSNIKLIQTNLENANEILNNPHYTNVRKQLMAGVFPQECKNCEFIEKSNGRSFRTALAEGLTKYIDKELLLQNTDESGYLNNPAIKYIELRLGRICNLRCRFCSPVNSTGWDIDYQKLYEGHENESIQNIIKNDSDNWSESDWFFNWFESTIKTLDTIQFAGGEPLISPAHKKIIDKLISDKVSKNINLVYVTNGTVLDQNLFERWTHFKSIHIFISLEGIENNYEYQRWPAKWKNIEKNIVLMTTQLGKSISKLTIQPHLNIFNVMNISSLAIWCMEQSPLLNWNKQLNFLTEPKWLSAFILTTEQKNQAIFYMHQNIEYINKKFSESTKKEDVILWLSAAAEAICKEDWSSLQTESKRLNAKLDRIRGCKSSDYLDEITNSFVCDQN
jgi:hypothetical protein